MSLWVIEDFRAAFDLQIYSLNLSDGHGIEYLFILFTIEIDGTKKSRLHG